MSEKQAKQSPVRVNGKFAPGHSGNPRGRPSPGLALAQRIRERVSPDELIDVAMKIAGKEGAAVRDRLAAVQFLAERGWIKPPEKLELEASMAPSQPAEFDLARLSQDERVALLRALKRARGDLPEPDDE